MFQLKKVAVVTFSASFTPKNLTRSIRSSSERSSRRRILFLFLQFKAKHRARLQCRNHINSVQTPIDQKESIYEQLDTFHRATKSIIFFSQLFGLLPVSNVLAENPNDMVFRLESWPMLFTTTFFIFGGLKSLQFTYSLIETGINAKNIVQIFFFYSNISTTICFLVLAKKWPQLLRQWTRVELLFLMSKVYKPISQWTLRFKLQSLALIFGVIALFEHIMYYASNYYNFRMHSIHCQLNTTEPAASFRDYIIKQQYKDVFTYFPYNIVFVFYAFFLNSTFTFIWNFLDVFIMMISLGIARCFQQLAKRIRNNENRLLSNDFWYEIRLHHIQLIELMASIDAKLSNLVLISCLNNMYIICNQLLNIFTKLHWPINYIYFWFSLIFLIVRTASVFLCAGQINDASLLPLHSLFRIPPGGWTPEVQRFFAQIKNEDVALTGKRFFNVTRKSLFGLMATIITYEFMLLQLDSKNWKKGLPPLCQ